MTEPLTIDNYPREIHSDYAKRQEEFDSQLLVDSSKIPYQTEIGVFDPVYIDAIDDLFGSKRTSWVGFEPPPGYATQTNRFFGIQIIRDLNAEKCAAEFYAEFEAFIAEKKRRVDQLERPKKKVIALLEVIDHLEQMLMHIRARIHQYAKG